MRRKMSFKLRMSDWSSDVWSSDIGDRRQNYPVRYGDLASPCALGDRWSRQRKRPVPVNIMALDTTIISQLAQRLEKARRDRVPVPRITDEIPDLSLADAYHIQDALRLIQIGGHASPAGLKMGFTSRAKMAQMKVKDPINGYRSEEHTSELQSLMRITYAVLC